MTPDSNTFQFTSPRSRLSHCRERLMALGATLTLCLSTAACGGDEAGQTRAGVDSLAVDSVSVLRDQTVVDVVQSDHRFSLFAAALDSAGLVQRLEEPGPITLFVPVNEAFQGAVTPLYGSGNRGRLEDVLLYHAVDGNLTPGQFRRGGRMQTLQGDTITLASSGNQTTLGGVPVVNQSITVGNGTVYVLRGALNPPVRADSAAQSAPVPVRQP